MFTVAAAVIMSPFMTGKVKEMPVDLSKEVAKRRTTSPGGGAAGFLVA